MPLFINKYDDEWEGGEEEEKFIKLIIYILLLLRLTLNILNSYILLYYISIDD